MEENRPKVGVGVMVFKEGKIFDGIWKGSKAIVDFLEKPENEIK